MTQVQHHVDIDMQQCISNCLDCHAVCVTTISHCLQMGGKHAEPEHIGILQDCAQICATSADFMLRGSQFHQRTCGVCAVICVVCADDCEQVDANDAQMRACVEACRRCADSCRQMASMVE